MDKGCMDAWRALLSGNASKETVKLAHRLGISLAVAGGAMVTAAVIGLVFL